jgi:hypothetical protein
MLRVPVVSSSLGASLCALALGACTPAQAPAVRSSGMVMALGGVAGIVGSAFAAGVTDQAHEMLIGFEVISAVGVLSYAYAELTWPRVQYIHEETLEQRHHRWAKILTERAAGAARLGRCARVRRLEVRVQKYDPVLHDGVFLKDPEILRCLAAPVSPDAPGSSPGTPGVPDAPPGTPDAPPDTPDAPDSRDAPDAPDSPAAPPATEPAPPGR